jgi:hypothetical protein
MLKTVSSITNATGALNYKGTWNASTNTPALASGFGTKGDYYVVSVAGTTALDGISTWYVGDWAAFNGTVWQRLEGGVDDPAPSLKSNSTTGLMQITGPAAGQTRVVTIPDANATMARTDAAQSFTGDQTLGTGNLIQGTAGKGFNFTANTPAAGMTSRLLNWYEEGNWTATVKGGTTDPTTPLTGTGYFTRVGRQVTAVFELNAGNTTGASGQIQIAGLPYANWANSRSSGTLWNDRASSTSVEAMLNVSSSTVLAVDGKGAAVTWASSGTTYMNLCITYFV